MNKYSISITVEIHPMVYDNFTNWKHTINCIVKRIGPSTEPCGIPQKPSSVKKVYHFHEQAEICQTNEVLTKIQSGRLPPTSASPMAPPCLSAHLISVKSAPSLQPIISKASL
ncbi:hypothetical protein ATANTOWER_019290 [Ataeniobius toweri]|uniref:Uncharacterized protein n=1 Tax=Ataeniobius toweri TaxID=208326 RepID=A0ABU7BTF5_9TELE|nr:hypothetical protein [Ataeniobius toweri]